MLIINSVLFIITAWLFLGMVGDATVKSDKKDLESRVIAALSSYYIHELFVSTDEEGIVSIRGEVDALYDKLNTYQIVSRNTWSKENY